MANHKSAEKRIRSSKKRERTNKRILSALRKTEKELKKDINNKDLMAIEKGLKRLFRLADKAKNRGVIKKNGASRKKSRFSLKANQAQSS